MSNDNRPTELSPIEPHREQPPYVRLPLKHAFNVRDLGGYPTKRGRPTKWGAFIRSDELSSLEDDEIDFLLAYGVRTAIDLRGTDEAAERPNPLAKTDGVAYSNIPMSFANIADEAALMTGDPKKYLPEYYTGIIKNSGAAIRKAFETVARAPEGSCVLFHCHAGKDRTGVMAALLLGLCGVSKYDILANYEISFTCANNNPNFLNLICGFPMDVMRSPVEYLEPTLDLVFGRDGGVRGYLKSVGLSDDVLARVENKLV